MHYRKITAILVSLILFSSVTTLNNAYATPTFGAPIQLDSSDPAGGSRVAVSGSNVFSVWVDQCGDIQYARSTDDGASFTQAVFPISGDTGCSGLASSPRVAAAGSNVYSVWVDQGGVGTGIFVQSSTDDGFTFNGVDITDAGTPFPASATSVSADTPTIMEISATGNYLYIVWLDGISNVQIAASADNGATFTLDTLDVSGTSFTPVVASSGDNAYVAWQNPSGDIILKKIIYDSGTTSFDFSIATQNLSGTGTATTPKIAATGTNVYVVWRDTEIAGTNGEIYFSKSTDSGDKFNGDLVGGSPGAPVNLSDNTGTSEEPDIAAAGTNVYVVWIDTLAASLTTPDILVQSSSDNGDTFNGGSPVGSSINLSDNTGLSTTPKISAFGTEAYVVWKDDTNEPGDGDILARTIIGGGDRVGGIKDISQSTDTSSNPQIASSATNVSVIWDASSPISVSFNHATTSTVDVALDKTQYVLGDTATITVVAGTGLPISVDISKNGGAVEFSRSMSETGAGTGVYTGTISFTPSSTDGPSGILNAASGDIIQVTEPGSGQTTFASILATGTISFTPITVAYDRGAIAHITVTDPLANTSPLTAQTVTVDVTSLTDTTGISMTLTETGPDTGVFGNTANNKLIFMDASRLFPVSGTVTITQIHTAADVTPGIDTISEIVTSTSDPAGITLTLTETGGSTGTFTGLLTLTSGSSVPGSAIHVSPGDILQVIRGAAIANSLITPAPVNIGAILVNSDPSTDTVTVTYVDTVGGTSSVSATVEKQFSSGGGAGGLVRPGLVLNVLAAFAPSGGAGASVPPSFDLSRFFSSGTLPDSIKQILSNHDPFVPIPPMDEKLYDFPLVIGGKGYALGPTANTIDTITVHTGVPLEVKLNILVSALKHLAFYTNVQGDSGELGDSDTYIIYDEGKPLQIVDPQGFFSNVKFDISKNGLKNTVKYSITFAKPMPQSDIILRAWDDHLVSADTKIFDAWEVVQGQVVPGQVVPAQEQTSKTESASGIPSWIKNNAKWWSEGSIVDTDFVQGIQYLIKENVMKVPPTKAVESSEQKIPLWIKTNAKWWADGEISDNDFVLGIQYLISHGIMRI